MNKTDIAKGFAITILRAVVGPLGVIALLSLLALVVFIMRELGHPDPQRVFGVLIIILLVALAGLSTYTDAQSIAKERKAKGELSLEHLTSAEWFELANEKSVAISQNGKKYIIIIPASIDIELDNYTTNDLIITEIRK